MRSLNDTKTAIKEALKAIHRGENVEELKKRLSGLLSKISPTDIPLIEQELIKEGVSVREILKLCDLHVALFREHLAGRELAGVPQGHPLDLLLRENEKITALAEALGLYAKALERAEEVEKAKILAELRALEGELRSLRSHYSKIQMLLFPYLEKMGLIAVPRVLWGKEDEVLLKVRKLLGLLRGERVDPGELAALASEVSRGLQDLVFRENKILFPSLWALLDESAWSAILEEMRRSRLGSLVEGLEEGWAPSVEPRLPHEWGLELSPSKIAGLAPEIHLILSSRGLSPDNYELRRDGDLELGTGYLSPRELAGILASLPLELTFADAEGRVRFYSESKLAKAFPRARTVLGRRLEFCHPPRLERFVGEIFEELRRGKRDVVEFWTRREGRTYRVLVVAVRGERGEFLGALEIAEDLTNVIERASEIESEVLVV
ncbi:MAG: DUF438 domain-containing protein [Fervidicoccaceae archaeon]